VHVQKLELFLPEPDCINSISQSGTCWIPKHLIYYYALNFGKKYYRCLNQFGPSKHLRFGLRFRCCCTISCFWIKWSIICKSDICKCFCQLLSHLNHGVASVVLETSQAHVLFKWYVLIFRACNRQTDTSFAVTVCCTVC